MVILFNFFSLGVAEIAVIVIAVIILIDPKNVRMIKPWVKKAYKSWLKYQGEVAAAEREVEEMKRTVLKPITDAEREVEEEIRDQMRSVKAPLKKVQKEMTSTMNLPKKYIGKNKDAIINPIKEIREDLRKEKPRKKNINPIKEIREDLQKEKRSKKRTKKKGRK